MISITSATRPKPLQWRHNERDSVCLTVFVQAQIKESIKSPSLAFVRGIHRWPVSSPHKGPVTRQMFPFDDVIMPYQEMNANKMTRCLTCLATIVDASSLVPCHIMKSLLLICKSGTSRRNLEVPDLQMGCRGLTFLSSYLANFRDPLWFSMGLQEIFRVTLKGMPISNGP